MKHEVAGGMKNRNKLLLGAMMVAGVSTLVLGCPDPSFAISPPTDPNAFAYELYNIAVRQILGGPVGFVGGVTAMVLGAISLITGRVLAAVPSILGGAALLKAESLITGLGLLF
jgi:hypothetical protein